ncbi:MAG: ABA4-like family protein [Lautropia sp.]
MAPDAAFALANTMALGGWLLLAAGLFVAAPWRARLLALGGRALPLALAAGYAIALLAGWRSAPAGSGFGSLTAVAGLFSVPTLLLAGWVHYLAFDLFVGRWIVDRAAASGVPRVVVLACLPPTFLFGPIGLLAFACLEPLTRAKEPLDAN